MPILINYGSGADLLNLSQQAGQAQGTAQRFAQERPIDAQVQQDAIRQAQINNAQPDFAQQHTGVGQTQYAGDTGVQTFVNTDARAREAARLADYYRVNGSPAEQQARAANVAAVDQYAKATGRGGTPAATLYNTLSARGQHVPPQIEAAMVGDTPQIDVARQRQTGLNYARAGTEDLRSQRLDETARHNQATEGIQRGRPAGGSPANDPEVYRLRQQAMYIHQQHAGIENEMRMLSSSANIPAADAQARYAELLPLKNKAMQQLVATQQAINQAVLAYEARHGGQAPPGMAPPGQGAPGQGAPGQGAPGQGAPRQQPPPGQDPTDHDPRSQLIDQLIQQGATDEQIKQELAARGL